MNTQLHDLVLRAGRADDEHAVTTLAELDSARPLEGDVLVAELDGRPVAALSLHDGRVVADPFERTAGAVTLLQLRAEHLAAPGAGRRRGVARILRRLSPAA